MKVLVPGPLHSYTGRKSEVEADGATLGEVLAHLDGRFPGLRFRLVDEQDRIRPHIVVYVAGEPARSLRHPVRAQDEVMIVAALSGG
ncbi:MAG: MoaD/ThiS family protein [Planctomycetes bacterium]|nr:MoaD/ThiS family protein [Planctomycetota bacterium]